MKYFRKWTILMLREISVSKLTWSFVKRRLWMTDYVLKHNGVVALWLTIQNAFSNFFFLCVCSCPWTKLKVCSHSCSSVRLYLAEWCFELKANISTRTFMCTGYSTWSKWLFLHFPSSSVSWLLLSAETFSLSTQSLADLMLADFLKSFFHSLALPLKRKWN